MTLAAMQIADKKVWARLSALFAESLQIMNLVTADRQGSGIEPLDHRNMGAGTYTFAKQ